MSVTIVMKKTKVQYPNDKTNMINRKNTTSTINTINTINTISRRSQIAIKSKIVTISSTPTNTTNSQFAEDNEKDRNSPTPTTRNNTESAPEAAKCDKPANKSDKAETRPATIETIADEIDLNRNYQLIFRRFRFDSPPKSDESDMSDDPEKMDKLNRMKAEKELVTSKADRKLYLGNLPPNITSQQLMDMLNAALKKMEINT